MSVDLGGLLKIKEYFAAAAIKGVAAGAAFLGVAAFHGAAAITKMSVDAAKAVGATAADAFKAGS